MQLVHPTYLTMLEHLHSQTLENFKTRLEQALNCGEGFAASVRNCERSCMLEFDKGCAGNIMDVKTTCASHRC